MEQVLDVKLRGTILMLERKLTTAPEISRGARIVDVGTTSESRDSGALLESDEVQKRYVGG